MGSTRERLEHLHWEVSVRAQMDVAIPTEVGGRVAYEMLFPEEMLDIVLRLDEAGFPEL